MRWLFALLLSASPALAAPYEITRVIDGDTVEIAVDFLPSPLPPKLSIRVMGIDTPEKAPRAQCDAEAAKVVIIRDGFRREIDFRKDQPSILDAASAAGMEVPFSCTSGVCGTCRAKLVEGKVRMERNFALEKNEVDSGFVLCCQAHPLTERVVLSFDER